MINYIVVNSKDEFVMIAPMKVLSRHFRLRREAMERIILETANSGICEIFSHDHPITEQIYKIAITNLI